MVKKSFLEAEIWKNHVINFFIARFDDETKLRKITHSAHDQPGGGIWGGPAKISHGFLHMEREDFILFLKFWTVNMEKNVGNEEKVKTLLNLRSS